MRILKVDSVGGASGDMLLGALIGLGVEIGEIQAWIERLIPGHAKIVVEPVTSFGIQGVRAHVELLEYEHEHEHEHEHVHNHAAHTHGSEHIHAHPHDHHAYREIRTLIDHAGLPERARLLAQKTFRMVAEAEGKIHGREPEEVTFHEVGAVDSIVDIVGCCVAFDLLRIDAVQVGVIPTGSGQVHCQHGLYPVPAPATVELIRMGELRIDSRDDEPFELLTPTGAALLGAWPRVREATAVAGMVKRQSNAFGRRELLHRPNLLRAMLIEGETVQEPSTSNSGGDVVSEAACNLDDVSPETLGFVMEELLAAGALDVWQEAIVMKKQRLGVKLCFLCRPEESSHLAGILFRETGALGLRFSTRERLILPREEREVVTSFGPVRVKLGHLPDGGTVCKAEFEDCRKLARQHDVPLLRVSDEAERVFKRGK